MDYRLEMNKHIKTNKCIELTNLNNICFENNDEKIIFQNNGKKYQKIIKHNGDKDIKNLDYIEYYNEIYSYLNTL